ncbi:MAG: YjfB family protein [Methanocella sp.]
MPVANSSVDVNGREIPVGGVSPIDQYPGQVNVLMMKKAMEVSKDAMAQLLQTMPPPQGPSGPPHLGQVVDVRM